MADFTHLMAREITYNSFKISLMVFMPNITTNHAITYTNLKWFEICLVIFSKFFPFHSCQVIRTLQQAIPECSSNQALAYANTVDREVREKYYCKIMEREYLRIKKLNTTPFILCINFLLY